jgi:hypothetical protein
MGSTKLVPLALRLDCQFVTDWPNLSWGLYGYQFCGPTVAPHSNTTRR